MTKERRKGGEEKELDHDLTASALGFGLIFAADLFKFIMLVRLQQLRFLLVGVPESSCRGFSNTSLPTP